MRRSATKAAIGLAMLRKATPPNPTTSKISSVAYATEEIGSEQKMGSASHLGSNVSPS